MALLSAQFVMPKDAILHPNNDAQIDDNPDEPANMETLPTADLQSIDETINRVTKLQIYTHHQSLLITTCNKSKHLQPILIPLGINWHKNWQPLQGVQNLVNNVVPQEQPQQSQPQQNKNGILE